MADIKKTILILMLFFLAFNSASAYCPPYFAKIDSIENSKECLSIRATSGCGGEVEIINHCQGEFYFYKDKGILNENFILINSEEWNKNYQKYQDLEKETNREYGGHDYISVGEEQWIIKIFSKNDNQDIIIRGRTVYEEPKDFGNIFFIPVFILVVLWLLFLIVFILKKIWKKMKK